MPISAIDNAATRRAVFFLAAWISIYGGMGCSAHAGDGGLLTIQEENDFFSPHNEDRHYTQGLRFSYLSGDRDPSAWLGRSAAAIDRVLPWFGTPGSQISLRSDTEFGQDIYTPQNTALYQPDPRDRPYAGWLYAGIGYLRDSDAQDLERVAVQAGIVGPESYARQAQNDVHLDLNQPIAHGWNQQIRTEPGLDFIVDRKHRFIAETSDGFGVDAIPEFNAVLGNIAILAGPAVTFRIGQNLKIDYGQPRNDPYVGGTDYENPDYFTQGWLAWYFFGTAEGRAVAHDLFLDGNSFRQSASVAKKPLVADLSVGLAIDIDRLLRLAYSYNYRTKQFYGQDGADTFGALTLALRLPF